MLSPHSVAFTPSAIFEIITISFHLCCCFCIDQVSHHDRGAHTPLASFLVEQQVPHCRLTNSLRMRSSAQSKVSITSLPLPRSGLFTIHDTHYTAVLPWSTSYPAQHTTYTSVHSKHTTPYTCVLYPHHTTVFSHTISTLIPHHAYVYMPHIHTPYITYHTHHSAHTPHSSPTITSPHMSYTTPFIPFHTPHITYFTYEN